MRKIKYTVEYWEGYDNSFHPVMVFDHEKQAELWAEHYDNPKPIYIFKRALTEEQIKSIMKR